MANQIDMRLMGSQEDLDSWLWFLEKMQEKDLINILEKSRQYPNRGESKLSRVYVKIQLNIEGKT